MSGTDGYRYPGPNEFEDTPADHLLFSGRDEEVNAITKQILSSRHLVLYGSSGLGKSSLLKAGVYPKLRENNFCPIRVRITDKMGVLQLLAESCEETGREAGLDYTPGVGNTPWEFFKTAMFWRGETLLYPVLILDQFEELFTTVRADWKKDFANEIGPLAWGNLPDTVRRRLEQGEKGLTDVPPQVKLIFSLREEFYGSLEELSADFPALFQDRFRLLPMNRSHAELAIRQPALKRSEGTIAFNTPPFTYADETIAAMLAFLAGRHDTIEPFQLQLLCQHIERVVVPGKLRENSQSTIEITPADLGGERVMSDLVRRFYTDSLAQLPVLQERRARELCDTGLLSSDGHRLMLERNELLRNYRISEETLRHLIDRRILREEPRLDSLFYEIGHDTIAHSIIKTRRWRLPRKYRVPAAVVASLIVIFTSYVIITNFRLRSERNRERVASLNAQQAQGKAEDARTKAEQLASYLIGEDLMEAIKPMGRLEVLQGVEKQISDYLTSLKSNQPGVTSDLSAQIEGLAHLNRGDIYYMQDQLTQAENEYEQAESSFQRLVQRSPHNPEWLHNLADAEAKRASVASDQLLLEQASKLYSQALDNIQTALTHNATNIDPKLSDKLLRDQADTYQNLGGISFEQRHLDKALSQYQQTVSMAKAQMQSPQQSMQQTRQWTYILEDGLVGEGEVLDSQGQEKAAEKALQEAFEIAKKDADKNQFEPETQRRYGVAENQFANFTIYREDPDLALSQYKSLNNIMQEAVRWEPKNEKWQRDFAYSFLLLEEAYKATGRSEASEGLVRDAARRFDRILKIDQSNASLASDLADAHRDWGLYLADAEPEAAPPHYKEALRLLADLRKIDSTNRYLIISSINVLIYQAALVSKKHPDEALDACNQALQLVNTFGPVDASDGDYWELVGSLHREIGDALRHKKDLKNMGLAYQASLNDVDRSIQASPSAAKYWNDRFLLQYDHMEAAEANADRRLQIDKEALADSRKATELSTNNPYYYFNLALVQNRIGDNLKDRNQLDSALQNYSGADQAFTKAIELGGKQNAQNYREWLCQLLEDDVAPLREKMHDRKAAQQAYERAIQIRKDEVKAEPQETRYLAELATAQTNLGDYLKADNAGAAFGYYTDAEQTYRNAIMSADETHAELYRTDLHRLISKHVAPLRIAQQGKEGSFQPYEEAVEEEKRRVAADPNNAANYANLAKAYGEIANDLVSQGNLTEASEIFKRAEESRREAIKLQPSADAWDELGSLYYNGLASVSEQQNNETAALSFYRQAADAEGKAVALAPKNATYLSNMGYAYQAIGNSLSAQHDPSHAEDAFNQSAEWFNKSALLSKDNPLCWYGLTLTSEDIAQIREDAGDKTTAQRSYQAALQAVIKAGELDPKDKKYSDERASIENKLHQLAPH